MSKRNPSSAAEPVLVTTPWWRRWMFFQSWRQAWMYARVTIPLIMGLVILLHYLLVGGVLSEAGEARAILIGALIGSLVHLLLVFPASLRLKDEPELRRTIHRILVTYGWQEGEAPGEYRYRHQGWSYPESRVIIESRSGFLVVRGPELLIRRLARTLRKEVARSRGRCGPR